MPEGAYLFDCSGAGWGCNYHWATTASCVGPCISSWLVNSCILELLTFICRLCLSHILMRLLVLDLIIVLRDLSEVFCSLRYMILWLHMYRRWPLIENLRHSRNSFCLFFYIVFFHIVSKKSRDRSYHMSCVGDCIHVLPPRYSQTLKKDMLSIVKGNNQVIFWMEYTSL